ncbi:glycoside hydrolase family 3 protein [Allobranchiibius sp. CTAmp26]|uniref:glycoside hydrolase family 3 protein n=1 Tax=Allobranchiibius sp. CTAmp26 TaxID=2815214 RepID=UPI001AA15718|nr:glycoside hydrolase family 3 protein [Allobranchiibius sp. CTAmp26]MBO1754124.1 glycoside hydrolase family 3 protein [Allobranchiibius sp. CTAmp26]
MRRSSTMILAGVASLAAGSTVLAPGAHAAPTAATQAATVCSPYALMKSMTLQQRVGQLFMVGTPATGASSQVLDQITDYHVGNVFLSGRSTSGTATPARTTAALRSRVTAASTAKTPLFIATDQEGGAVQVLQGSGFSRIPAALTQGSWSPSTLQSSATTWARQLAGVGVNLNLAPVADTVPSAAAARNNPPIGVYQREYGYTSYKTTDGSTAFLRGMTAGNVGSTTKHFPGLGLVTANTDTSYGVHDRITTASSPYLNPFKADIKQGVTAVMMSSAIYDKIDPSTLAVFSTKAVRLVTATGFAGPIMTDDVGNAVQPGRWPAANRAVNSLYAGVDLVLTVNPSVLPTMYDAILQRAQTDPWWESRVESAAWHVLMGKSQRGLLANGCTA